MTGPVAVAGTRAVWVHLELAFPRPTDHQRRFVADGLDLTGRVPGVLWRWERATDGTWFGLVRLELTDGGAQRRLILEQQLVPAGALEPRDTTRAG